MTIGEQFERHFKEIFHIENVRVHYQGKVNYREPQEPLKKGANSKRRIAKPPKQGTLRFKITELLKAAPDGLTAPEMRAAIGGDVTSNVISGMLWTMSEEYKEVEPCGHRVIGAKNCRVYRWVKK